MSLSFDAILKKITLAGLFLIPAMPLIVAGDFFFPFITGKGFYFRIIVEIITASWVILAIRNKEYRPTVSRLSLAVVAFIGIMFLADLAAENPFKAFWSNFERMEGFFLLLHLALFFIVASSIFRATNKWHLYFHTWIGTGIYLSLFGILQLTKEIPINQGSVRIDATLGNAAYFASVLLVLIFLSLRYLVRAKRVADSIIYPFVSLVVGLGLFILAPIFEKALGDSGAFFVGKIHITLYVLALLGYGALCYLWLRPKPLSVGVRRNIVYVAYAILIMLFGSMLFYTATRGAILGTSAGLFVGALILALVERNNRRMRLVGIGILTAGVLFVGVFMAARNTAFIKKDPVLSRFASISLKTGETRFMIWNIAWQGFKERPILGWGQEGFNFVFNKYYDPRLYGSEPWFDRTHNVFFDWLIAGGIFALLSYLSLFALAMYYLFDRHTRGAFASLKERITSLFLRFQHIDSSTTMSVAEKAALAGLLVACFVQNLFVFDNAVSYVLFFSVLGYIHGMHGVSSSRLDRLFAWCNLTRRRSFIAIGAVTLLFGTALYMINIRAITVARSLIVAIVPHDEGASVNIKAFRRALSYSVTGHQEVVEQFVTTASQVTSMENAPEGIKNTFITEAEQALGRELERNPNDARLWVFKGSLMTDLKRVNDAVASFKRASELTPRKQSPLFALGTIALQQGEVETAVQHFKNAYDLEPEYKEARYMYAVSAAYARRYDLAESILRNPDGEYMEIDNRIVQAYASREAYKRLLPILESVIEGERDNADLNIAIAVAYIKLGRGQDAIKALEFVKKIRPQEKDQFDFYIQEIKAGRNP